jgi:hypothetical protein
MTTEKNNNQEICECGHEKDEHKEDCRHFSKLPNGDDDEWDCSCTKFTPKTQGNDNQPHQRDGSKTADKSLAMKFPSGSDDKKGLNDEEFEKEILNDIQEIYKIPEMIWKKIKKIIKQDKEKAIFLTRQEDNKKFLELIEKKKDYIERKTDIMNYQTGKVIISILEELKQSISEEKNDN